MGLNMKEVERELAEDMRIMERAIRRELAERARGGIVNALEELVSPSPPPYSPSAPSAPELSDCEKPKGLFLAFKKAVSEAFRKMSCCSSAKVRDSHNLEKKPK